MIRGLALVASFAVASVSVAAQSHPPGHPQGRQHGPEHKRPGPAMDPALHALLHGTWAGSFGAPQSASSKLQLAVAQDKQGNLTLKMSGDRSLKVGAAKSVAIDGKAIEWTQDMAGAPCKAKAVVTEAIDQAAETLDGTIVCSTGERAFALTKTKS